VAGPEPAHLRETVVGSGTLGNTKRVTYLLGKDLRTRFEGLGGTNSGTFRGESWTLQAVSSSTLLSPKSWV
jgi:hypothetical protein